MEICRRCGGQFEDDLTVVVDLEGVLGTERHQQALTDGPDNVLTEEEKTIFGRSEAERTYCGTCYYLCSDKGHNIWECGIKHKPGKAGAAAHDA